jgi:hypothetical protein
VDPTALDELQRLRARAYGPGADISRDPAALARLEELEEQSRLSGDAPREVDEGVAAPEELASVAEQPEPEPDAAAEDGPSPSRWQRWLTGRRGIIVGIGATVVAVIVSALLTTAVTTRTISGGVTVQAELDVEEGIDVPDAFGLPDDTIAYAAFYGVRPVRFSSGGEAVAGGDQCIYLFNDETIVRGDSIGVINVACGAEPFPLTMSLRVGAWAPAELSERYPRGTALQFRVDGDRMIVSTGPPPSAVPFNDRSAPRGPAAPGTRG